VEQSLELAKERLRSLQEEAAGRAKAAARRTDARARAAG
jgi:hypothetical protein